LPRKKLRRKDKKHWVGVTSTKKKKEDRSVQGCLKKRDPSKRGGTYERTFSERGVSTKGPNKHGIKHTGPGDGE